VTPLGLASKIASQTLTGMVRLATDAEVAAGLDPAAAVTPATLLSRVASTTATGLVQLATSAETIAGVDAVKAVTPATLASKVASTAAPGIVQLEDGINSVSTTFAATANSVRLAVAYGIPKNTLTAKGSLISASASSAPLELLAGANGAVLNVDTSAASGLAWTTLIDGGSF
jgi:hypothetical protein